VKYLIAFTDGATIEAEADYVVFLNESDGHAERGLTLLGPPDDEGGGRVVLAFVPYEQVKYYSVIEPVGQ
jgi:hypothetical protein